MKQTRSHAHRLAVQLALGLTAPVVCLLSGSTVVHAQVNTASLSGIVTDPSGAAVANAEVLATSTATGLSRKAVTDGAGFYSLQNLPIGVYKLSIASGGFETSEIELTLNVGEKGRQDVHLQVGAAQQTVQVESGASSLSPDDASISTVVGSTTIEQTPLYLRNWDDLLRTVPGVQISRFTQQSGATSAGRTGDFNVNGIHSLQNNFLLDGIDNNTFSENVQELSTESAHPSVDVIQEFNVITNPYSAEYGRSPGAVVSVNTRSGTNKIHGLAFEYGRNAFFDANDWFTARRHAPKPENNQHQFGGSFGGPLVKDHLFGFFNYEGTRIKQGVSRIPTVPLPNERIGDFSPATAAQLGIKYPTIVDPLTCAPAYSGKNCTAFANNTIPADRLDSSIQKIMALYPLPNLPGEVNNYARNARLTDSDDSYDGRIDWNPSPADSLFGRYNYSNRSRSIPGYYGGLADGTTTSAWGDQTLKSHSFVLGWTHVFTPSIVNEYRFGFSRNYSYAQQQPFNLPQQAGDFVPGIPHSSAIGGGVPLTQFSGSVSSFIGSPDFLPKKQIPQLIQNNDTLSFAFGRQTLKVGGTVFAPMRNIFQDEPGTRGDLGFTGVFSGFAYADGLLGYAQSDQLTNVFFVDQRLWMLGAFVEDDWKVTPKLTLNLGLRYDFATPALEGRNRIANFNPAGLGSLTFAKSGSLSDRGQVETNTKNLGPRFGFAYSPTPSTVIRGGYGLYYSLFERFGSEDQLALNPPFLINKTKASNTAPVIQPQTGFPSGYLDPASVNLDQLSNFHIRSVNPHDPTPNVQQWSLGVQHEFPGAIVAEADYVGTKSTHLDVIRDYNQPLIVNGVAQTIQPYNNPANGTQGRFGQVEYTDSIGFGNYNGLQASLNRRFQSGLSLRAAYTYSRALDNAPQELESNSGDPPDGRNYGAWYGLSDFDIPHRVSVNYVYELPFGHGRKMLTSGPLSWIIGDFRTSGVYTFYSGHPFTANEGSLNTRLDPYGFATAVPIVNGHAKIVGKPDCWYYSSKNQACGAFSPGTQDVFTVTAPGVVGNSGRNTLRGPRTNVFDFSLMRDFPLVESANLQFRWEVFNLTNTPEFGQPNGNITSTAAGTITTLSGDPRVMQFALRLSF